MFRTVFAALAIAASAFVFGCHPSGTEEVEVRVEVEAVAAEETTVEVHLDVERDTEAGAGAQVIGLENPGGQIPSVVVVVEPGQRPVQVELDIQEDRDVETSQVVGLRNSDIRVSPDILKNFAGTSVQTDWDLDIEFDHTIDAGAEVIGLAEPGIDIK